MPNSGDKEVKWIVCPIYCLGVLCQYPIPLPIADLYWRNINVVYPCAKAGETPLDKIKDPVWKTASTADNKIVILIQYRHAIDGQTKSMKVVIKPEASMNVDDIYRNVRQFVIELMRLPGPMRLEYGKGNKLHQNIMLVSSYCYCLSLVFTFLIEIIEKLFPNNSFLVLYSLSVCRHFYDF